MPRAKKRSKTAKLKRQGACTTFGKRSRRAPSLESSEYCVSDNHSSESIVCLGRAINVEEIDNESEEEVEAAVEALQRSIQGFCLLTCTRRQRHERSAARSPTGQFSTLEAHGQRFGERELLSGMQQRGVRRLTRLL